MPDGFDTSLPIVFDAALPDEAFLTRLNSYAAAARKKGASVWYAFCPTAALSTYRTDYFWSVFGNSLLPMTTDGE